MFVRARCSCSSSPSRCALASAQTLVRDMRVAIGQACRRPPPRLDLSCPVGTTSGAPRCRGWGVVRWRRRCAATHARDKKLTLEKLKTQTLVRCQPATPRRVAGGAGQCWRKQGSGPAPSSTAGQIRNTARRRSRAADEERTDQPRGQPAPKLTAREVLGAPMPEMKGHPVVLFFWAHWCRTARRRRQSRELGAITGMRGCW
jgi:hypothetical protein